MQGWLTFNKDREKDVMHEVVVEEEEESEEKTVAERKKELNR